ncbi:MAG: low molecular weight protein arginine phosphatase [Caldilineales bacterium]
MKQVLVVCTANICRSPMAMGLLRQRIAADGLEEEIIVHSAGVYGLDGQPASQPGVELLAERAVDISEHRAHTISAADMEAADLVLVMEESHRRTLFHTYPHLLYKVFLFSEMAGDYHDIRDPYRQPREAYEACVADLGNLLERGYPAILRRLRIESRLLLTK